MFFRSLEVIYFSWIVPIKSCEKILEYDEYMSAKIAIFSWITITIFLIYFELHYRGLELKMQAKTLGYWKKISEEEAEEL